MKSLRIFLAAGFVAAAMSSIAPAYAQTTASPPSTGAHDFDFLVGEWRVHHRRLQPDSHEWVDFEGTSSNRKIMDGGGNLEEHTLNAPNGAYRAVGLRSYDAKSSQWAIDGKPMRVRLIWSQITATSARWEQAYSHDAGISPSLVRLVIVGSRPRRGKGEVTGARQIPSWRPICRTPPRHTVGPRRSTLPFRVSREAYGARRDRRSEAALSAAA